jgi:hypothetical protein
MQYALFLEILPAGKLASDPLLFLLSSSRLPFEDDLNQLRLGKAWDEVTSEPYRLQIPQRFCRHATRPGPDDWGQQCIGDGFMCVHINEAPFADWLGFESIVQASLTVFFWLLCAAPPPVCAYVVGCLSAS